MENQAVIIELTRHLKLSDVVNLAQVNKKLNQLMSHDLIRKNMYCSNFFQHLMVYDNYRYNFQLAWCWLHPSKYSILLKRVDGEYLGFEPLYIFDTSSIDLIADKIIDIVRHIPILILALIWHLGVHIIVI